MAEGTNGSHQIEHSISRKKILLEASCGSDAFDYDDQYDSDPENREAFEEDLDPRRSPSTKEFERADMEQQSVHKPRNDEERLALNQDEGSDSHPDAEISTDKIADLSLDVSVCNTFPSGGAFDPFSPDSLGNEEDSWITVGDLETTPAEQENHEISPKPDLKLTAEDESREEDERQEEKREEEEEEEGEKAKEKMEKEEERENENIEEWEEEEESIREKQEAEELSPHKTKEVRFRDEPEYVNEHAELVFIEDSNDEEPPGTPSDKGTPQRLGSPPPDEGPQRLLDVKTGREIFEVASTNEDRRTESPIYDRLSNALENTRVMIVEKPANTGTHPDPRGTTSVHAVNCFFK